MRFSPHPFLRLTIVVLLSGIRGVASADDPPPSPPASPEPAAKGRPKLTLPELIKLGRERSPIIDVARSQIAVRERQKYEAETNWAPSGDITFGISPAVEVQCQAPAGLPNPDGLDAVAFRKQNCLNTIAPSSTGPQTFTGINVIDAAAAIRSVAGALTFRLTQPLYTFGKIEHGAAAAGHGIRAEEARTDAARLETDMQVTRAYWGLKAARTALVTASDVRDQLVKWVDKIQGDIDADKPKFNYTQTDLQRLKVAVSQLEIMIAEFDRLAQFAENGMRAALSEDIDIDDEELEPVEVVQMPLDYYQREALLHRPEVHALDHGSRAYRELAKYAFSLMLPDVGLNVSFTYRFAPTVEEATNAYFNHANGTGFGASLGVRIPMDIAQGRARWKKASAEADAFDALRRAGLVQFQLDVAQSWTSLTEARIRMSKLDRAQHQAQGWLNGMEQQLDLAMTDTASAMRDFVDAARNYYDLRLRYFASIYDVNVQIAQLRRATGVDVAR